MTKEEAYKIVCSIRPEQIEDLTIMECDAMDMAIQALKHELLKPQLPAGLDEAAEEIWGRLEEEYCQSVDIHTVKVSFKAGAEWMAGQGVTKEAVIGMATEEISINVSQKALDDLDVCPGDKVIVQIRKAK